MTPHDLRSADRALIGTLITSASEEHAEAISQCGLDWVFIDAEHGALDIADVQRVVRAVGDRVATLVRVPEQSEAWLKRVLATGCSGVIVPMVNSVDQARAVASMCHYAPTGTRSIGPERANGYGAYLGTRVGGGEDNTLVVVQAEHIDAVQVIDDIVAVPGISAVFIGPYDLSASMGHPGELTHPDVVAAIATIRAACTRVGMPIGIFAGSIEAANTHREYATLLACGTDLGWLMGGVRTMVDALRS
jgi:2-dehydro-3-deoxyglucarate aldolase